jgi:Mg-chelatase subunit ChlD
MSDPTPLDDLTDTSKAPDTPLYPFDLDAWDRTIQRYYDIRSNRLNGGVTIPTQLSEPDDPSRIALDGTTIFLNADMRRYRHPKTGDLIDRYDGMRILDYHHLHEVVHALVDDLTMKKRFMEEYARFGLREVAGDIANISMDVYVNHYACSINAAATEDFVFYTLSLLQDRETYPPIDTLNPSAAMLEGYFQLCMLGRVRGLTAAHEDVQWFLTHAHPYVEELKSCHSQQRREAIIHEVLELLMEVLPDAADAEDYANAVTVGAGAAVPDGDMSEHDVDAEKTEYTLGLEPDEDGDGDEDGASANETGDDADADADIVASYSLGLDDETDETDPETGDASENTDDAAEDSPSDGTGEERAADDAPGTGSSTEGTERSPDDEPADVDDIAADGDATGSDAMDTSRFDVDVDAVAERGSKNRSQHDALFDAADSSDVFSPNYDERRLERRSRTRLDSVHHSTDIVRAVRNSDLEQNITEVFEQFTSKPKPRATDDGDDLHFDNLIDHLAGDYTEQDVMIETPIRDTGDRVVGVALDASSSQGERGMFEAKMLFVATMFATEAVDDDFAATAFSTGFDGNTTLVTAPGEDFHYQHLDSVTAMGSTPTADGFRHLLSVLDESPKRDKVALVVTDGKPNVELSDAPSGMPRDSIEGVRALVQWARRTHDVVVIGLGTGGVDASQMDAMFGGDDIPHGGYVMATEGKLVEQLLDIYLSQFPNYRIRI